MTYTTPTETEKAYIAGLVDGEGWIGFYPIQKPHNQKLRLGIANSDLPLLEWVGLKIGGCMCCNSHPPKVGYTLTSGEVRWSVPKPQYMLYLAGRSAANVIELLLPYLRLKKEHALKALEQWEELEKDRWGQKTPEELRSERSIGRLNRDFSIQ